MNRDTVLQFVGLVGDLGVLIFALRGKLFRIMPVFCSYVSWCLLNDILFIFLVRYLSASYFRVYWIELVADSLFQFAVLVELEWAVLRPIRASLPKYSIGILAFLVIAAGAMIWPIARWTLPANLNQTGIFFVQLQQTIAALRVVFFIAMAGFSQVLSIGWRNRELQIATGLGFYSMCALSISLIHAHQAVGTSYHLLDQIGVASYICSLVYWIVSFSQQEEARQEFTPQMRSFLLALTGSTRGARMALADSAIGVHAKPEKPSSARL